MTDSVHPAAASSNLPPFITAPGEADVLMIVMGIFLLLFTLAIGILFLRIHHLPDHWAHKKVQYEIVCVLGLIAMLTHQNIFWVAALLLALVDIPDFVTPLRRIARSTEMIANDARVKGAEIVAAIDYPSASHAGTQSPEQ